MAICKSCSVGKTSAYASLKRLFAQHDIQITHPVFHSTSYSNADKILSGGFKARAGGPLNDAYHDNSICFTRNLCFSEEETFGFGDGEVIFVLDLNELKNRFKAYPYDYHSRDIDSTKKLTPDEKRQQLEKQRKHPKTYEYEERISRPPSSKKETVIPPKYIKAILIKGSNGRFFWWEWHEKFPFFLRSVGDRYNYIVDENTFWLDPGEIIGSKLTPATPEELDSFDNKIKNKYKSELATHMNASPKLLTELYESNPKDINLLKALSENPNTPVHILKTLSRTYHANFAHLVREGVAQNTSTPVDILRELADDENPHIRSIVAANKNIDLDIALNLAKDYGKIKMELFNNLDSMSFSTSNKIHILKTMLANPEDTASDRNLTPLLQDKLFELTGDPHYDRS